MHANHFRPNSCGLSIDDRRNLAIFGYLGFFSPDNAVDLYYFFVAGRGTIPCLSRFFFNLSSGDEIDNHR